MNATKRPGKARKYTFTAPKHKKAKALAAHLSEKLSAELKTRSLPVRKKDIVKIVRGEFKGKDGKVIRVDPENHKIFIEKIVRKKSNGTEFEVAIDPSKVILMDLDKSDKKRI
ncbi:MAG TPA: 50S ribosomal protein L24 [archaeon]|nr:50S ribosomal protein L24 [archaeon]